VTALIPPNNLQPGDPLHIFYHNNIADVLTQQNTLLLVPTAVLTANYTANPRDLVLMDTTAGSLVVSLPIAPPDMTCIEVKMVGTTGGHTTTINTGGADQFNADGTTSRTLTTLGQSITLLYTAAVSRWYGLQGENAAGSGMTNPMNTLGDVIYGGSAGAATRLAGDTSNVRKLLRSLSSAGVAAAPVWDTLTTTDMPNQMVAKVVTLTDASTIAVDASLGNDYRVTIGASRTMGNPTNPLDGQKILFQITQGGAGSFTITWSNAYIFSTGLPQPTLTTTTAKTDLVGFVYNGSKSKWLMVAYVLGFS
jgi:hypothetical protein